MSNKAKYKLEMFVRYTKTSSEYTGVILGVTSKKDGFYYQIDDNSSVPETDILTAYKEVAPRKAKQKTVQKKQKTARARPAQETESETAQA